ncbi:MAG: glutamyl-tRNA reductase [Sinobacterium sp.]|jgi:glutamyl-tRNA reductase
MRLVAVGMNHDSAPLVVRERVALAADQVEEALADAQANGQMNEVILLSTCNRTEVFAVIDDTASDNCVLDWLSSFHDIEKSELTEYCYCLTELDAVSHIINVAAGLDSMVLGEPQIFGQIKSAYSVALELGSVGTELSRLFQHCFSAAKKVRTDTAIGENPVSVAYAAVDLSKHIFSDLEGTSALLIGAGETIELVASHLSQNGVGKIVVANRTLGRAKQLADRFSAEAVLLAEIPEQLDHADIVISSTGSQLPILGKGAVESALKRRRHKPIFMVDIAVPRDIEPEVGDLADVYLYSIDDLRGIVEENKQSRASEASKAEEIVAAAVAEFSKRQKSMSAVSTVRAFRQQGESMRDAELDKALKMIAKGDDAQQVLQQFAKTLTNKLLHGPSIKMKQASADGREEFIKLSQELYDLTELGDSDKEQNNSETE